MGLVGIAAKAAELARVGAWVSAGSSALPIANLVEGDIAPEEEAWPRPRASPCSR